MKLLLDTSVIIDHLRGYEPSTAWLLDQAREGAELWSVTVVRTEVLAGMRPRENKQTLALLGALRWQEVSIEVADAAGDLARKYLKSFPGVDTVDYLIAAGATLLNAELCTRNLKHFPMFPRLTSPYL